MEILALKLAFAILSSFREMAYPVMSFLPQFLNIVDPGEIGNHIPYLDVSIARA